ncbi:transposase [Streptomyces sp. NPDC090032]|uniref:transposase n=1 Tax=unclassified Streptomyces TaxID=2593676 RepID=UPI0037235C5A
MLPVPAWLEGRGGQPEGYCHREMLDAVRHLIDNGIKWRAMPVDFPAWSAVCAFFRRWREQGLITEFHHGSAPECGGPWGDRWALRMPMNHPPKWRP